MNTSDHHDDAHPHHDADHDTPEPTMGANPGEQGDFASGKDGEGQHAEQAVDHSESLEDKTDSEVGPSTEREHPTPKAPGQDTETDTDGANHTGDANANDADSEDDAHANEPRTDEAAPPAQGPAA